MCLMPAAVRDRLAEARPFYLDAGPVGPTDTCTLRTDLTELVARAVLHGQDELALALSGALNALDHLRVVSVAGVA